MFVPLHVVFARRSTSEVFDGLFDVFYGTIQG